MYCSGLHSISVRGTLAVVIHTEAWGRVMDWLSALPLLLGSLILHLTIKQKEVFNTLTTFNLKCLTEKTIKHCNYPKHGCNTIRC